MKEQSVYLTNFPGVIYSYHYINVQKQLGLNKQLTGLRNYGRLEELSGKLKCSKCGYAIKAYHVSSDGVPYLSCYGRTTLHVCDVKYTKVDFIELQQKVGNAIQNELDGLTELYNKLQKESNELEIKAEKIRKDIKKALEISLSSDLAAEAIVNLIEEKQAKLNEIELKIEMNRGNADYTRLTLEHNVNLKGRHGCEYRALDFDAKCEIVRTLIDKIVLTEDINDFEIKWLI